MSQVIKYPCILVNDPRRKCRVVRKYPFLLYQKKQLQLERQHPYLLPNHTLTLTGTNTFFSSSYTQVKQTDLVEISYCTLTSTLKSSVGKVSTQWYPAVVFSCCDFSGFPPQGPHSPMKSPSRKYKLW